LNWNRRAKVPLQWGTLQLIIVWNSLQHP